MTLPDSVSLHWPVLCLFSHRNSFLPLVILSICCTSHPCLSYMYIHFCNKEYSEIRKERKLCTNEQHKIPEDVNKRVYQTESARCYRTAETKKTHRYTVGCCSFAGTKRSCNMRRGAAGTTVSHTSCTCTLTSSWWCRLRVSACLDTLVGRACLLDSLSHKNHK